MSSLRPHRGRIRFLRIVTWLASTLLLGGTSASYDRKELGFTKRVYSAFIYENHGVREYLRSDDKIGVHLPRGHSGSRVRFKIISGNVENAFKTEKLVAGDFCFLLLRTRPGRGDRLNRERRSHFRLKVRVRERHASGRRARSAASSRHGVTAEIHVKVLDRNDLTPWFERSVYSLTVPEDMPLHTAVVRLHADDADEGINGEVYYSFAEVDDHFAVDASSGQVVLMRRLNHSRVPEFSLSVLARDRGPGHDSLDSSVGKAAVHITVTPVNLHDPVIAVTHMSGVLAHSSGLDVYAVVRVDDADAGRHGEVAELRIVDGDPQGNFVVMPAVQPGEFLIAVDGSVSAPQGYNLTLKAYDRGAPQRYSVKSLHVRLMDAGDRLVSFSKRSFTASVRESALIGTNVVRLAVVNGSHDWPLPRRQILRFSIVSGNEDGQFAVNTRTGLLRTNRRLDAETRDQYELTVSVLNTARQSLEGTAESRAQVVVRVLDDNDNTPQFVTPNSQAFVDENEPADFYVSRVTAVDADTGGGLTYSLVNADPLPFVIDAFDGTIRTSERLDFETQRRRYVLHVRVSDWGTPMRRQAETTLTVAVRNVNDNRPQFERVACQIQVSQYAPPATELLVLSAVDMDPDTTVGYRVVSTDGSDGCFHVDELLGILSVTCDLTGLSGTKQQIGVMAHDGQHFSDEMIIKIAVVDGGAKLDGDGFSSSTCEQTGVDAKYKKILAQSEANNRNEQFFTVQQQFQANHHRPVIDNCESGVSVKEDASVGSQVLAFKVIDDDHSFGGALVFAITNGDVDSVFEIEATSGVVRVVDRLDREWRAEYSLNVSVCDLGVPQLCSSCLLSVRVEDVNDNAPQFHKTPLIVSLSESSVAGEFVARLRASDADVGRNAQLTYQLIGGEDLFRVNSSSGIVTLSSGDLDRERQDLFEVLVIARDNGEEITRQASATLRVHVTDVNDNAPAFPRALYRASVAEDVPVGSVVASVEAFDVDLPVSDEPITYRLLDSSRNDLETHSGDIDYPFVIDRRTGAIRLQYPLDYESRPFYNISVMAVDDGDPPRSSTTYVLLRVNDVNENWFAPTFDAPVMVGRVAENEPAGTFVVAAAASDRDVSGPQSLVKYSIRGGSGTGRFFINETGIYTSEVLDRESSSSYWLTVYAEDSAAVPLHDKIHVYVSVLDRNDNRPLSERVSYWAEVMENCAEGTVVAHVTATDRDGHAPLHYRLLPNNTTLLPPHPLHVSSPTPLSSSRQQRYFSINSSTGEITTTGAVLDREQQEFHHMQVLVSDRGRASLSSLVHATVRVLDLNDGRPVFLERLYTLAVPWGPITRDPHRSLIQLVARDNDIGDAATLTYALLNDGGLACRVDPLTGRLYLGNNSSPRLDHKYQLQVSVEDAGDPPLSSSVRLLIAFHQLLELDNTALSMRLVDAAAVYESDPAGHLVAMATTNMAVIYAIEDEGNIGGVFGVSEQGAVIVVQRLDREQVPEYTLNVTATNGRALVWSLLTVSVMDVNDCRPRFDRSHFVVNVSEQASRQPSASIISLSADDMDGSQLHYYLDSVEDTCSEGLFSVNAVTGEVTANVPLNSVVCRRHTLTVRVTDGEPVWQDFARVSVLVPAFSSHAPRFDSSVLVGRVEDGAAAGTRVISARAVSVRDGHLGEVFHTIIGGNTHGTFMIESDSGQVLVATRVRRHLVAEFMLVVRALDSHNRQAVTHVNILVTAPPHDQLPPTFSQNIYKTDVVEDALISTPVATVSATVSSGSVVYSLACVISPSDDDVEEEQDSAALFQVNPGSGTVYLSGKLDYERHHFYNISVLATNMAGVSGVATVLVHILDVNDNRPIILQPAENCSHHSPSYQRVNQPIQLHGRVRERLPAGARVFTSASSAVVTSASMSDDDQGDERQLKVRAMDADSFANARLVFIVLDSGDNSGLFAVDPSSGAVFTTAQLDHEATPTVTFEVHVRDSGRPSLHALNVVSVSVTVEDMDDESPEFSTHGQYYMSLLSPAYHGQIVGHVLATDIDSEQVSYSLSSDAPVQYEIEKWTGAVRVSSLDVSSSSAGSDQAAVEPVEVSLPPFINVTVTASDGEHKSHAQLLVVATPLTSVAGSMRFQRRRYVAHVMEDAGSGGGEVSVTSRIVTAVDVTGVSVSQHVHFSILTPSQLFTIANTSGVVRTSGHAPLDRESRDVHVLVVEARGHDDQGRLVAARATLQIHVIDVNDHVPLFVGAPYHVFVNVDSALGTAIYQVEAVDEDIQENGLVQYSLVAGPVDVDDAVPDEDGWDLFSVEADTGVVKVERSLNARSSVHRLVVEARDSGVELLRSTTTLTITLIHASQPCFEQAQYNITTVDTVPLHTALLSLQARSHRAAEQKDTVFYQLLDAHRHDRLFDVDFDSGVLRVASSLQHATRWHHQLTVAATQRDSGVSCSTTVMLHITRAANLHAPHWLLPPPATTGSDSFSVVVSERTPVGSVLSPPLPLTDRDLPVQKVSCHVRARTDDTTHPPPIMAVITSPDDATTASCQLILTSQLDRELVEHLQLQLVAEDTGTPVLSSTLALHVRVEDVNDNRPVFVQSSVVCQLSSTAERGQFVAMVTAVDADQSDRLVYDLVEAGDLQAFSVDKYSGLLRVHNPLHVNKKSLHSVNVSACDGIHCVYASVAVHIANFSKEVPVFARREITVHLSEDVPAGSVVTQVEVSDLGSGQLTYGIDSPLTKRLFTINASTGVLRTVGKLDRETRARHMIEVSARDSLHHAAYCTVSVHLLDVNDCTPQFTVARYRFTVSASDAVAGDIVAQVYASDCDEGENGRVSYSVYPGVLASGGAVFATTRHHDAFTVHPSTGDIVLMKQPRQLETGLYRFFVMASDSGERPLSTTAAVEMSWFHAPLAPSGDRELNWSTVAPPVFQVSTQQSSVVRVREDTDIGKVVASVQVSGADTHVLYSVCEDGAGPRVDLTSPTSVFEVDERGSLLLTRPLDREVTDRYNVTLSAEVAGSTPPLVSQRHLQVFVDDINDNAPVFAARRYSALLRHNAPPGTRVVKVEATDADTAANARIRYQLASFNNTTNSPTTSGAHMNDVFSIDEASGWIVTLVELSRESLSRYQLYAVAVDTGWPELSARVPVVVHVIGSSASTTPRFSQPSYTASVSEDSVPGSKVLRLEVMSEHDEDVNSHAKQMQFYITSGDRQAQFQFVGVTSRSADLLVRRHLDRESIDNYQLHVSATDGSTVTTTTIHIDILDVDDNRPQCEDRELSVIVGEDTPVGSTVVSVRAHDADQDAHNSMMSFHLSGHNSHHFSINQHTGEIQVARSLDREQLVMYNLSVEVSASALVNSSHKERDAAVSCVTRFLLTLTDVNDCAPQLSPHVQLRAKEDAAVGSVIGRLRAADRDLGPGGEVEYYVVGEVAGDNRMVSIDRVSGVVTLSRPLDRELHSSHSVVVELRDLGVPSLSSTATVQLVVLDINDNEPVFERATYHASLTENATSGTHVIQVTAVSRDSGLNGQVSYSIAEGNDDLLFSIDPHTGDVYVMSMLDYESARGHMLLVVGKDGGSPPLSGHALLNISVVDSNDHAPVFTQHSYSALLPENTTPGHIVLQVQATDADSGVNSAVVYSIEDGDPEGHFSIDPILGQVRLETALDRETVTNHILHVTAKDGAIPAQSGNTIVSVIVEDVNDNAPQLSQDLYSAYVQEDGEVGVELVHLRVSDPDGEGNGAPFTFTIARGNDAGQFTVDSDGRLLTAAPLHRLVHSATDDDVSTHRLHVTVSDSARPPLTSHAVIEVTVIEAPQFAPVTVPLRATLMIPDASDSESGGFLGAVLGRLHATDQDPHDRLRFALVSLEMSVGAASEVPQWRTAAPDMLRRYFEVDPDDGLLLALAGIPAGHYRLNATVGDGKFVTHTHASVDVRQLTHTAAAASVTVSLRGMSARQFVMRHVKQFRRALRRLLHVRASHVFVLAVRNSPSTNTTTADESRPRRNARSAHAAAGASVDVLTAVRRADAWLTSGELRRRIAAASGTLARQMDVLPIDVSVAANRCASKRAVCGHGRCSELVQFDWTTPQAVVSDVAVFVSPGFSTQLHCHCHVGHAGHRCDQLINECGHHPCSRHQICVPSASTSAVVVVANTSSVGDRSLDTGAGYSCKCPAGRAGGDCQRPASECVRPHSCYWPNSPLQLDGTTILGYQLTAASARRFVMSLSVRTTQQAATLVYASGLTEFHALELHQGHARYRFDCGAGETRVSVTAVTLNDGHWHTVLVKRFDRHAELIVDAVYKAQVESTGDFAVLTIDNRLLYVGGRPSLSSITAGPSLRADSVVKIGANNSRNLQTVALGVWHGLIGCLDNLELDGQRLPLVAGSSAANGDSAVLLTEQRIQRGCDDVLPQLDGCASAQPCLNGGSCVLRKKPPHSVVRDEAEGPDGELSAEKVDGDVWRSVAAATLQTAAVEHFECVCAAGFTGVHCQINEAPCVSSPCLYDGYCLPDNTSSASGGGFSCRCRAGLTGDRCQHGRHCHTSPCINGGVCEDTGPADVAFCRCGEGFAGQLCELDVDECLQRPCLHGGSCVNMPGSYLCRCLDGWTGEVCDRPLGNTVLSAATARPPLLIDGGGAGWNLTVEHLAVGIVCLLLLLTVTVLLLVCWRRISSKSTAAVVRHNRRRGASGGAINSATTVAADSDAGAILLQSLKTGGATLSMSRLSKLSGDGHGNLANCDLAISAETCEPVPVSPVPSYRSRSRTRPASSCLDDCENCTLLACHCGDVTGRSHGLQHNLHAADVSVRLNLTDDTRSRAGGHDVVEDAVLPRRHFSLVLPPSFIVPASSSTSPPHAQAACSRFVPQSISKPTASVAPCVAVSSVVDGTSGRVVTTPLMSDSVKCTQLSNALYDARKTQQDCMDLQLLALNRVQLPANSCHTGPVSACGRSSGNHTSPSSPNIEMPGYHWDCSDWAALASQSPAANITEVAGTELRDSASCHSNELRCHGNGSAAGVAGSATNNSFGSSRSQDCESSVLLATLHTSDLSPHVCHCSLADCKCRSAELSSAASLNCCCDALPALASSHSAADTTDFESALLSTASGAALPSPHVLEVSPYASEVSPYALEKLSGAVNVSPNSSPLSPLPSPHRLGRPAHLNTYLPRYDAQLSTAPTDDSECGDNQAMSPVFSPRHCIWRRYDAPNSSCGAPESQPLNDVGDQSGDIWLKHAAGTSCDSDNERADGSTRV